MADPISRAITVFGALKGLEHQEHETRRQARLDALEEDKYLTARRITYDNEAWAKRQRERQEQEWADADVEKARGEADQILLDFTRQMEAEGKTELAPGDVGNLLGRLEPVSGALRAKLKNLYDPSKVEEKLGATERLLGQLSTGHLDHDGAVADANIAFGDELDARGSRYGAKQLRISQIVPSPQGDGVMFNAEVTKEDGTTYRSPLTENGGTAEQGDNVVKNFRMEQIAPYLVGQLVTLRGAKAYLTSRGKIKPVKLEKGGSPETGEYVYNPETGEMVRQLSKPKEKTRKVVVVGSDAGGRELVYEDTGERVRTLHSPIKASSGDGSGGGKLPAEAQLVEYYIDYHGMSREEAREEAKRAKDNPRQWKADHYTKLLEIENEKLPDEPRLTPEELRQQADADAEHFFGAKPKADKGGGVPQRGPALLSSHGPGAAPASGRRLSPPPEQKRPPRKSLDEIF